MNEMFLTLSSRFCCWVLVLASTVSTTALYAQEVANRDGLACCSGANVVQVAPSQLSCGVPVQSFVIVEPPAAICEIGPWPAASVLSHDVFCPESTLVCEPSAASPLICSNSQCVTVKKNPLGCLENIEVLADDEVWLINARASLCGEIDTQRLNVFQLNDSQFSDSTLASLTTKHDSDQQKVTVMYIHGNQTNLEFAISRGLQVYRNAFAKKSDCRASIRFVIWAWKSEQEKLRLYPDFVVKSQRSVMIGDTFATTLNQFGDRNMLVFGYSLGVQVALSAFDSPLLNCRDGDSSKYHVAFAAPAINADYVASHALTIGGHSPIAQTFVFTNQRDRAIRAAQAIIRRKSMIDEPSIAGLARAGKLDVGAVSSIEVSGEAGPFHSIERYTRSEKLQSAMAALVNTVHAAQKPADPEASAPVSSSQN